MFIYLIWLGESVKDPNHKFESHKTESFIWSYQLRVIIRNYKDFEKARQRTTGRQKVPPSGKQAVRT